MQVYLALKLVGKVVVSTAVSLLLRFTVIAHGFVVVVVLHVRSGTSIERMRQLARVDKHAGYGAVKKCTTHGVSLR